MSDGIKEYNETMDRGSESLAGAAYWRKMYKDSETWLTEEQARFDALINGDVWIWVDRENNNESVSRRDSLKRYEVIDGDIRSAIDKALEAK